jgi:hypothetical protein
LKTTFTVKKERLEVKKISVDKIPWQRLTDASHMLQSDQQDLTLMTALSFHLGR